MNRFLLIPILAAGLGACASYQRIGPPAPIVDSEKQPARTHEAPDTSAQATSSSQSEVEVFPYQPPSSAPDAANQSAAGALPKDGSLISERPSTSAPSPTPTQSTPSSPAPTREAERVVAHAPRSAPISGLPPAADALVRQADTQRQSQNYVGAAATLERALGIAPQNPYIWNRLARVRVEQGLHAQAGNLAKRSNALAGDRASLKQDNWQIISAARRSAGDIAGAEEAARKASGG